jgi:glutamate dehydrogenase/leucine dehydrogenase
MNGLIRRNPDEHEFHQAVYEVAADVIPFIFDPGGIDAEKLEYIKELKNVKQGRLFEYAQKYGIEYQAGKRPWSIACDLAFPCATQNEIDGQDAATLVKNGCIAVAEGANMPTDKHGCEVFLKAGILYAPSKAANAGGVAVSGLEMTQNSMRLAWPREDVDRRLREIIDKIHAQCVQYGTEKDFVNYHKGANIAGFIKVADAVMALGIM